MCGVDVFLHNDQGTRLIACDKTQETLYKMRSRLTPRVFEFGDFQPPFRSEILLRLKESKTYFFCMLEGEENQLTFFNLNPLSFPSSQVHTQATIGSTDHHQSPLHDCQQPADLDAVDATVDHPLA